MRTTRPPEPAAGRLGRWLLACGVAAGLTAAQPEPGAGSPAATETASLAYEDLPSGLSNWSLAVVKRTTPFDKEPDLKGGDVFRGTLQCGPGEGDAVAFVWDRRDRKLHVDLNRNLDLSDDAAGVFSATGLSGTAYQVFNDLRLPLVLPTGTRSAAVTLNLYDRPGGLLAYAGVRSLWLGQVALAGQEWQVGVFDDPFERGGGDRTRHLLLRPWADREQPAQLHDGASPLFAMPTSVFLGGRAYGVAVSATEAGGPGDPGGLKLEFTERQTPLGELKLPGQHIERLALEGDSWVALLVQPTGDMKIPAGRYECTRVRLAKGDTVAVRDRFASGARVAISEGEAATLDVGGPLTNSVSASRRGPTLVLSYRLVGAGGEPYQVVREGLRPPPGFAIYRGDEQVASGKFEFG